MPSSCSYTESCPGSIGEVPGYPVMFVGETAERVTSRCADREGYTGEHCSMCMDGFYANNLRCHTCGLDSRERRDLIITLVAAVIFVVSIALSVAISSDSMLVNVVAGIMFSQTFIQIARQGSVVFGESTAGFIQRLDFVNFKYEFVKPGCTAGDVDFADIFWISCAMVVGAAVLFVFAALLRRSVTSMCILGYVFHLLFTLRCIEALHCVKTTQDKAEGSRLAFDPQMTCFDGRHVPVLVFATFLLVVYVVGFPVWCLIKVYECKQEGLQNPSCLGKYGFLYRNKREKFWYFLAFAFVHNIAIATSTTLPSLAGQLTLCFLSIVIQAGFVGVFMPLDTTRANLIQVFAGLVTGCKIIYVLSRSEVVNVVTTIIAPICALVLVSVVSVVVWHLRRGQEKVAVTEDTAGSVIDDRSGRRDSCSVASLQMFIAAPAAPVTVEAEKNIVHC